MALPSTGVYEIRDTATAGNVNGGGFNSARGAIRPGLTVYLCAITTMVYFDAQALLTKAAFTEAQAFDMTKMIVGTILYLTTTCVLWWFGTRNKAQPK